jgi:choline-glycine betaine transporter
MAWAPVAACFLGRVAYGHKIKDVIVFTLVWPALFGMVWMTIFSGTAIHLQISGQMDLVGLLKAGNASAIPYAVLSFLGSSLKRVGKL